MNYQKMSIKLLFMLVVLAALSQAITAQSGTLGSSKFIAVNKTTIYLNSTTIVNFSVNLVSGTAGYTYLVLGNSLPLLQSGISIGFAPQVATPPFTGVIYISTYANPKKIVPGTYTFAIVSGGADPTVPGTFNLTVTVMNSTKPSSAISTSTIPATVGVSSSIPVSSSIYYPQTGSMQTDYIVAAIIIVILIVVLLLVLRNSKMKRQL